MTKTAKWRHAALRTTTVKTLLLIVAWGVVYGCASQSQTGTARKTKNSGDSSPAREDSRDDSTDADQDRLPPSSRTAFEQWCELAGETAAVQSRLQELYRNLCSSNGPTALFKSQLFETVYDGQGTPQLKSIESLASDKTKQETSYHFGVTIRIPISMKTHFNKVAPKAGDVQAQKQLAEANGAVADIRILKSYENDGEYHVRGWDIYSKNTKKGIVPIVTETESRSDQFQLKKDQLFLYSQYVTKSLQTVRRFDMLTAGIQAGSKAYLVTVVKVVVDNKRFPGEAERQLKQTAIDTVKKMYSVAAEAQ